MGLGFVSFLYVNLSIFSCLLATWSPGCSTAVLALPILCEALPLDEWLRLPWRSRAQGGAAISPRSPQARMVEDGPG